MKSPARQDPEPDMLLVTIDEAARRLSIGRSHIYEVMRRGGLRSVRIGRSRRILERDLEAYISQLLDGPEELADRWSVVWRRPLVNSLPLPSGRR